MPKLYAGGGGVSRETADQAVTKVEPVIEPKAPKMTKTFQVISGDIAPNGYKGFGANQRQYRVQEKGGMSIRNPVLYPPELQGQELPKARPIRVYSDFRRPFKLLCLSGDESGSDSLASTRSCRNSKLREWCTPATHRACRPASLVEAGRCSLSTYLRHD
jgi:hypothetical protein